MTKKNKPHNPRIVHIAQSVAGGIASYLEEIADYQSSKYGAGNVAFLVPAGSESFARLDPKQLISFRSASRGAVPLLDFAARARSAIARLNPDIVHLHSSFSGAIVRGLLRAARRRPKIVYCPHGWAFSMDSSPAKTAIYAAVERRLARTTDLIYVNSQFEFDLAERHSVPTDRMRVIENGIGWTPRAERPARTGPVQIAFIGRHDRQKGLDILLDTIGDVSSNLEFHVVGDTVISAPGTGTRKTASANVTFHGWLSRSDTLAMLRSVDAVVMPSRWEAFGLVAIEAMRAGVPVIASNRGALPEIVVDGETGHVFDLDEPASLRAILDGLDRQTLDRLGMAGRERWERLFVADRMNERISEAYDDVLSLVQAGSRDRDPSMPSAASKRQSEPA